jgi:hypothetical protein
MQHDMNEPVRSTVNVNVTYSYVVIVETANTISKQENWLSAEITQALKFTAQWVKGMLNGAELLQEKKNYYRRQKNIINRRNHKSIKNRSRFNTIAWT